MLVVLLLILAVILAMGMTFFATQNPSSVPISFFGLRWNEVPLYLIVLLSLLLGLLISWLFGLVSSISSSITMFGKEVKIKQRGQTIDVLNKRIEDLKNENTELREKLKAPRSLSSPFAIGK